MRTAILCALVATGAAAGADKPQFPPVRWSGVVADEKKQKAAPESGLVIDQKTLDAIWKAWCAGDPPRVNFDTHFVLVQTKKAKLSFIHYTVTDEGELTFTIGVQGDKNGPKEIDGFGYAMAVVPREGVKRYNGKALP